MNSVVFPEMHNEHHRAINLITDSSCYKDGIYEKDFRPI